MSPRKTEHKSGGTPLKMARYNEKLQCRKLSQLLSKYFNNNDYFITLYYPKSTPPEDLNHAKAQLSDYISNLRQVYKDYGKELKYIKFPICTKGGRVRHYIIINKSVILKKYICGLWAESACLSRIITLDKLPPADKTAQILIDLTKRDFTMYHKCYITSRNISTACKR
ncbi:MAG: hypothetical protein E7562_05540 [Ruminococcaceae bacterium]|nr:hypothetical protein [Oscillospiraceae bacterium]